MVTCQSLIGCVDVVWIDIDFKQCVVKPLIGCIDVLSNETELNAWYYCFSGSEFFGAYP